MNQLKRLISRAELLQVKELKRRHPKSVTIRTDGTNWGATARIRRVDDAEQALFDSMDGLPAIEQLERLLATTKEYSEEVILQWHPAFYALPEWRGNDDEA
jgi:hypothetical protein